MANLYQICWLMIAQATPPGAKSAAVETAEETAKQPGLFEGMGFFLPAMLMVMALYMLFMTRSQPKGQNKTSPERLANLKKNDRVVTAGGIIGTIVNLREDVDHITIRIDESSGTKMQVLRQSVVRVLEDEKE